MKKEVVLRMMKLMTGFVYSIVLIVFIQSCICYACFCCVSGWLLIKPTPMGFPSVNSHVKTCTEIVKPATSFNAIQTGF